MMFPANTIAVIPAAGAPRHVWGGTMSPASDAMLPIAGKPAIYWTLRQLQEIGIRRVAVVVEQRGNELESFVQLLFGTCFELRFAAPDRMLGVGYSVALGAREFTGSPPLIVVLGDTIPSFNDTRASFSEDTVFVSKVEDQSRWCLAKIANGKVQALYDKPTTPVDTDMALIGVYYFSQGQSTFIEIVKRAVDGRKHLEMVALLDPLLAAGRLQAQYVQHWLDVGNPDHVYEAQAQLIQSRSFNQLTVDAMRGTITKHSHYEEKFFDEINYFLLLPDALRIYFPRMVTHSLLPGRLSLELEFYAYPTLADLFLFEKMSPVIWRRTFQRLYAITTEFVRLDYGLGSELAQEIYIVKNEKRIAEILDCPPVGFEDLVKAESLEINGQVVPGLKDAMRLSREALTGLCSKCHLTPIHGDLCFSNILCEPARGLIKFIDPRGSFGRQGILGDFRYDIAKLYHSVFGLYDFIVNDLFHVENRRGRIFLAFPEMPGLRAIQEEFRQIFFANYEDKEITLITAWLFLSMLPLHKDSPRRQMAIAARGLELLNGALL